jgi:hypothetical protein
MGKVPVKSKKHSVRYNGVLYDSVPSQLRFRGAVYEVVAAEKGLDFDAMSCEEKSDRKKELEAKQARGLGLTKEEEAFLEKLLKDTICELENKLEEKGVDFSQLSADDPQEQEPTDPSLEQIAEEQSDEAAQAQQRRDLQRYLTDENLAKWIGGLADDIKDHAADFLSSAGLNVSSARLTAVEEDGVDVAAQVDSRNFKGDNYFVLDYSVKFPRQKGKEVPLPEEAEAEPEFIQQLARNILNVNKASYKIQEIIFHLCAHNFVPSMNDLDSFLSSMAFLQNGDVRAQAGALREVPKGVEEGDAAAKIAWAQKVIKQVIEQDYEKEVGFRFPSGAKNWGDRPFFDKVLQEAATQKLITQGMFNKLTETLDEVTDNDPEKFRDLVREVLRGKEGEAVTAMQKTVERAVQQLTKHEDYRGSIKYGVDEDGDIIAAVEAPYPFRYIFKRSGKNVMLKEAQMEFCDYTWATTSQNGARRLISANLELAHAFKRAVNPSMSQSRKEMERDEMYKKIRRMLSTEEVMQGVDPAEAIGIEKKEAPPKPTK